MLGVTEIILIIVAIIGVSIFGRKTLKNLFRIGLGAKKDLEEVKKEFETKSD